MIDTRNHGYLCGGIVADPEKVADGKLIKIRLAVDYAGYDKDNVENKTGYFNLVGFLGSDDPASKFLISQTEAGNLKKGSQIAVVYRLKDSRWSQDDNRRSSTDLYIEAISYYGNKSPNQDSKNSENSSSETTPASDGNEGVPIDF